MASKPVSEQRRNAFAALALVSLAMAPMAAKADSIFDMFSPYATPYAVQNNVARWGFVPHSALTRRGDVYLYDVADRNGVSQRLIIDARTGRIMERYMLRPSSWADARPPEPRPRADVGPWTYPPRPEVDVPAARPNFVELFPEDAPPVPPEATRVPRQRQLAYGDGHLATPPTPEPKLPEKPKPKLVRPKPAPSPAASDQPETATAAPSASEPSPQPATTVLPQAAPANTQVPPAAQQPAATEPTPATSGVVASSGTADAPAAKVPAAQPTPAAAQAPKGKAINDIPVAPLD